MKLGRVSFAVATVLAACTTISPNQTASVEHMAGRPVLGIENGTTLTVGLFVNGRSVGASRPGVALPPIDFSPDRASMSNSQDVRLRKPSTISGDVRQR